MNLIKWKDRELYNPWGVFEKLQNEINTLFDTERYPSATGLFEGSFSPSVDVVENANDFTVRCEMPGIDEKNLDVSIASNVLTIKGEKKGDKETKKGRFFRKESLHGSFQRTLSMPSNIDQGKIKADLKNGILELVLPKKEESKPKQISVKVN